MKVQRKEIVIVTMDIKINDPFQNFGNTQPQTSYTILYRRNSIKRMMDKTLVRKKGAPPFTQVCGNV
jgi:hypothetical protein